MAMIVTASGQITANIETINVPTGTLDAPYFVIDSDADNADPGYERDKISVSSQVRFTWGPSGDSGSFRIYTQLIDPTGNPVMLANGLNYQTSSTQAVNFNLFLPTQTKTFSVSLDPAADLGAGVGYQVKVSVQKLSNIFWNNVDGPDLSTSFVVLHFNDTPAVPANRNVRGYVRGMPTWTKNHADRNGSPASQKQFSITFPYYLGRYDLDGILENIPIRITATLMDDLGNNIPLEGGGVSTTSFLRSVYIGGSPNTPYGFTGDRTVSITPVGQLDPRNRLYKISVRFEHEESPSVYRNNGETPESGLQRLLHFNGTLKFGTLATNFTSISNIPVAGSLGAGYVNTSLDFPSATIPGFLNYNVGAGGVLPVQLQGNGDAVLTGGTRNVVVAGGGEVSANYGGVNVSYPGTVLGTGGASAASTIVYLPQGLGVTLSRGNSGGVYDASLTLPGRALTNSFRHTGSLSSAFGGGNAWVFDEARPLLYRASQFELSQAGVMLFDTDAAEWVHSAAFDQLEAQDVGGLHQNSQMSYRLGNDGHLRFARINSPRSVSFLVDSDNSVRTAEADLEIEPGSFRTHFPKDATCTWAETGDLLIRDGKISPDSKVGLAANVKVEYDGSCENDSCGPGGGSTNSVIISPAAGQFRFTPDGGIYAPGEMVPDRLFWGIRGGGGVTHHTDEFSEAEFLASGHQLYSKENPLASGGALKSVSAEISPASVLLAGYDPALAQPIVYPGSVEYTAGNGAYAGATTIVSGSGSVAGSKLADRIDDYEYLLQDEVSKYYVRASGVSGRHVAAAGGFDPDLTLYGYHFKFSRFQLTYLSNENWKSWINGQVDLPYPSNFNQAFLGLTLTCTGALDQAPIDPKDAGNKPLTYWNGSFRPYQMRFAPSVGASCYDPRTLAIGLVSGAANISTPLAGTLAFRSDGNIAPLSADVEGVDSRLGLPPRLDLKGPGTEKYSITPVSKLYFNDYATSGAPRPDGFVSFAGRVGVPFFQDIEAHIITSTQADAVAPVYMAGSWTAAGKTHFTNTRFDADHRSFPPSGITADLYRKPTSQTAYVPHAKQSLFGLVSLDYPLKWDESARFFRSWSSITSPLLVVSTQHQVDYLSADNAELTFGAQYEGMPQINLVSAAVDAADGHIGAARAITQAASQTVTNTLNQGVDEIGKLVDDDLEKVLDVAMTGIENQVIDPLYQSINNSYQAAALSGKTYDEWVNDASDGLKGDFDHYFDVSAAPAADGVKAKLKQLGDLNSGAFSLLTSVQNSVDDGILAIDSVAGRIEVLNNQAVFNLDPPTVPTGGGVLEGGLLAKSNNPTTGVAERQIVQKLVRELLSKLTTPQLAAVLNPLLLEASSEVNQSLNELLVEFDPTLNRVTEVLLEARGYLVLVRAELQANGEILESFGEIIAGANTEIDTIVSDMRETGSGFIDDVSRSATYLPDTVLGSAGDIMGEFSKEEFVALLRAKMRDRLLAAAFVQQIQFALRQSISELEISMNSAIDSAFSEVSRMCRALVKDALGPINDKINGLLGDVENYVGAGSLDGYAHIQGDTLRRLRIDAKVQMKVPDDMELQAYFEMLCYDSSSTVGSGPCLAEGDRVVEVKIGALDVPLDWLSPDMRVDLGVWFAMKTSAPSYPLGIGGDLTMTSGELDFQSLKIKHFAAGVGVGLNQCYLAATAGLEISNYEASGGIFFGRTCSIEPLLLVDPDVGSLLGQPPFSGAYVYGEAWVPISEAVLGIPASCFFRISAGVGAGAFYFVEGPTFGGKMLLGVSGEALCLVSIRGDVTMTGVMNGGSLRFKGKGTLKGKAGYCPFCVKFKESAEITYQNGSWDFDY